MRLSENFYLSEFLHSQRAEREGGQMYDDQLNPGQDVVNNLAYLARHTIQPLRTLLKAPISISSGYRCEPLNTVLKGSKTSQHMKGQAADLQLVNGFTHRSVHAREKDVIEAMIKARVGRSPRVDVNANFYLFALACMFLDQLDVDQLIHEYGKPGAPGWVHMSASVGVENNRREILQVSTDGTAKLTLEQALLLGC